MTVRQHIAARWMWWVLALLILPVSASAQKPTDDLNRRMERYGMVDVCTLDSTIVVDLRYGTADNFVHKRMYDASLTKAYLTLETAKSLVKAQRALKKVNPKYSLIVYDAARPQSAQRAMWEVVKGTENQRYVASPGKGGPHNFGVAVDVTILYEGKPVDMGTGFDSFSTASHITDEPSLVKSGKISRKAMENRRLLRRVMTEAGFMTYRCEWWHFERHRVAYARRYLRLLDF